MIYAMHAAARRHIPIIVLDRPNPLTGDHVDGPMLDTALANPDEQPRNAPAKRVRIIPLPAASRNDDGRDRAVLQRRARTSAPRCTSFRAAGWRRAMWFDETGLPWVRPSPNLPTSHERARLSVARGVRGLERLGRARNERRVPAIRRTVDGRATRRRVAERTTPSRRALRRRSVHAAECRATRNTTASAFPAFASPSRIGTRCSRVMWQHRSSGRSCASIRIR